MKWIDITQPLNTQTTTWEGDVPFTYTLNYSKDQTGSVNLGQIQTSLHTGTHLDAPFHYDNQGETIEQLDINQFIGVAQVIHCVSIPVIQPEHLATIQPNIDFVLLRTTKQAATTYFPKEYSVLSPTLAPFLQEKGVKLIGVDTPTIDPVDSKELHAHHALHESKIAILENIVLNEIKEGLYDCIALPLPIVGGDGSPVRAVIRSVQ